MTNLVVTLTTDRVVKTPAAVSGPSPFDMPNGIIPTSITACPTQPRKWMLMRFQNAFVL